MLWTGNQNRKIGFTNQNEFSSRSHSIYTVSVEKIHRNSKEKYNFKVTFVDLAGSERLKKTGATGERFKEGISINSGLLALSKVIMALSDKDKKLYPMTHIPYRESKLTRLLKDSLSGNSITVMIGCISPSALNTEETLNTLNYSSFARSVKIQPLQNIEVNDTQILKDEIRRLKEELDYLRTKSYDFGDDKSNDSHNNLHSLRLNKNDFNNDLNNLENSISGENAATEENSLTKENLRLRRENEELRNQISKLKQDLEIYQNKETDLINKLSKAVYISH